MTSGDLNISLSEIFTFIIFFYEHSKAFLQRVEIDGVHAPLPSSGGRKSRVPSGQSLKHSYDKMESLIFLRNKMS